MKEEKTKFKVTIVLEDHDLEKGTVHITTDITPRLEQGEKFVETAALKLAKKYINLLKVLAE